MGKKEQTSMKSPPPCKCRMSNKFVRVSGLINGTIFLNDRKELNRTSE